MFLLYGWWVVEENVSQVEQESIRFFMDENTNGRVELGGGDVSSLEWSKLAI